MLNYYRVLVLFSLLIVFGCASQPRQSFNETPTPTAPDYRQERYWAALPWRSDAADTLPDGLTAQLEPAAVDVFFLHPTTYTGKRGQDGWNGPVNDPELQLQTNQVPIRYQASLFTGVARVFAPYYRQAHLQAYYSPDTSSAKRALGLAYEDVRNAFRYYLNHYNQGRPIIIAAHSQGTSHAIQLVKEFFDGQPLQQQLVTAYLVGIMVKESDFQQLRPCQTADETGCYCAWRTFRRGYTPSLQDPKIVVTNPLLWTTDETYAPDSLNLGAVLRPFDILRPGATDAQVSGSILWASKPKFPGSFLLWKPNYHAGDFNLYYSNVRANALLRTNTFLQTAGNE